MNHKTNNLFARLDFSVSFAQADLKAAIAADEARAIADDNSKATDVFISGATGPNAARINGHYVPTQETGLDGRILYLKSDFECYL